MDRHVMEALGRTRVVIEDGKVVEVGEPRVKTCPLFKKYRGIEEFNRDTVKENIEYRIEHFGMCSANRCPVSAGVSHCGCGGCQSRR